MSAPSAGRPVILLVDDMEDVRAVMGTFLEKCGYRVITATGGREAVAIANEAQPDLILMDIYMPGGDGLTAGLQIRREEATSHIPIVIISAYGELGIGSDLHRQAAAAGCMYLDKPFDPEELRELIERLL